MSKLKTLKDIEPVHCYECEGNINPENLKSEAVKWVKKLSRELEFAKSTKKIDKLAYVTEFIKHFFNLTKEDLE